MAQELQHPLFKCVMIGDTNIGKSSIWSLHTLGECRSRVSLPIYCMEPDPEPKLVTVDGKTCKLQLWNLRNVEGYERLRPLNYLERDVFIICFSLVDRQSFENVLNMWYPEVNGLYPKSPKILVGTKLDLRREDIDKSTEITYEEGFAFANEMESIKCYVECSALTGQNINTLIDEVVRTAFKYPVKHKNYSKRRCIIL